MPSVPLFTGSCETSIETEEICITWLKPEGGNEIENYIVQWMIVEDNLTYFHIIPYNGVESNNYTINNLQPAQAVNVSIRANNSAGESEASWNIFATGRYILYQHGLL